ncbi:IC1 inhibitor, partial [Rhadina sibilatrix]|nr:IC1 inhibitor [Rhadina sibilatrix]
CVHGALQQLASSPGLFSAARIFHHPELRLRPRFLNDSLRFYGARPYALSGNESLDLQRINAWADVTPVALKGARAVTWLPGTWRDARLAPPWWHCGGVGPWGPAVALRWGSAPQVGRLELNGGLSLVVLMPRGPLEPLETLERALDPSTFLALLRRAARTPPRATALSLPRLRLDLTLDVVAVVHDMDFGLFLDAELCGLARGPAAVDTARHRAVLALDEAGVEAAAAMATSVARSALVLEALRPFLFVLWHNTGDFPVFMGRLSDPQP